MILSGLLAKENCANEKLQKLQENHVLLMFSCGCGLRDCLVQTSCFKEMESLGEEEEHVQGHVTISYSFYQKYLH